MNHTPTYRNEENYCLPWEYDKAQLTIWQKDTSDDGNQENAEIANNVDLDIGAFIVTACNGYEDLVNVAKAASAFLASAPSNSYSIGYQENRQALSEALVIAGVKV